MLLQLSAFLKSSDFHSGFKENFSCVHAIYTIKEVMNYFNKQQSALNLAALDISKTFDNVKHCILFNKLLHRNIYADLISFTVLVWQMQCYGQREWREFSLFSNICWCLTRRHFVGLTTCFH